MSVYKAIIKLAKAFDGCFCVIIFLWKYVKLDDIMVCANDQRV